MKLLWHWRMPMLVTALCLLAFVLSDQPVKLTGALLAFCAIALSILSLPTRSKAEPQAALSTDDVIKALIDTGLSEIIPEPALIIDKNQRLLSANALAHKEFENLSEGEPLTLAFSGDILSLVAQVIESQKPAVMELTERGQVERFFEAHISPLTAQHKPSDAVAVIFRNLTKHRRVEQMRVDFVANASHELRTPLAALSGFVETLQGPAKNDPVAQDKFLTIMQAQAERMRRLIDDLLSLSRIEVNAHVRPDGEVELRDMIEQTVDSLQPLAKSKDITLSFSTNIERVSVQGERDELIRLVENFIQNAVRYGGDGKKVDVSLQYLPPFGDQKGEAIIAVRDYGAGIAPEHLPRLTERFYRADKNESRAKGGTGLGLAIVKHIVNRHRGRLNIESTVGEGSTFSVRLDVLKAE